MAGGTGERFWPISRMNRPKQLLNLTHPEQNMLCEAVERIATLVSRENVFVSTSEALREPIAASSLVTPAHILVEPARRNTLGALVWTTARLMALFPTDWMELTVAVVTADHKIGDDAKFLANIQSALELAEQTQGLVTIGIPPTRAETGFGYIEIDRSAPRGEGSFRAKSFREKPDRSKAEEFLASKNFLWNSGMFFWTLAAFHLALDSLLPEVAETVVEIARCLTAQDSAGAAEAFATLPNLSVDYAIMERADNVYVVESEFSWDDVGAWDALERTLPRDEQGNVISGNVVEVDSHGCIVLNDSEGMVTCVLGLEEFVVVTTADAVLVCPKSRAQEIRRIVAELKNRSYPNL